MYSRQRTFTLYLFVIAAVLGGLLWPAQMTARSPQETQMVTPQLFFPVMHHSVQDAGRTWNGTFSIQNMGKTQANVQVIFYDQNGQQIMTAQLVPVGGSPLQNPFTLAAGGAATFDIASVNLPPNAKYSLVVASDQPLAGIGWTRISGGGMSNGMYNALTPDAGNTVYLPAVKTNMSRIGGNLAIQNLSNADVSGVLVKFYNQQGQQVGQVNAPTIQAYSSFHLSSRQFNMAPGFDGSVVVTSLSPVAVVNNQLTGANDAVLESYTGEAEGATAFTTILNPVTQLTVMNTSPDQPATVNVTVQNGAPGQMMIAPLGTHTFNLNMQVQDIATVASNQPVVAVATNASSNGTGTVIEADRGAGSMRYVIPFAANQFADENGGNSTSNLVVYNPGNGFLTFEVIRLQQGQPVVTGFGTGPGSIMVIRPQDLPGLPSVPEINSFLVQAIDSPFGPPVPFFVRVSTQTNGPAGDGLSFYNGIPVPQAPVTIQKTVDKQYVKGGDTLTYRLQVSVGEEAGSAVITDDLPEQFTNYTYSVTSGLVLTVTGETDYVWDAFVPANGGVISITGVVTSPVDVVLNNVASIAASTGNANSNVQVLLDVTPPDTAFGSKPSSLDSDTTPTFTFTGNDGNGSGVLSFECKVDNGDFAPCTTPYTTASLSDGEHTLQVRAIDLVGHVDPTPASYTWTIDTTAPAVPALSSPDNSAVITSTDVVTLTWEVVEDEDVAGYEVTFNGESVDAGNVTQRVVGPLANGVYSWTVSVYDGAGNSSANAAVRTFTVDKRLVINPNQTSSTTLTSSDGFTPTISVPAGAIPLTGTLEMSYQPLPTEELPAPPEGGLLLGFSLDLLQDGAVQSGVVFSKPITISIAYDSALVSDPSSLQLFYLDANNEWSNDGITIITPIGNPLVATLTHLTDFGLAEVIATRSIYLPSINR